MPSLAVLILSIITVFKINIIFVFRIIITYNNGGYTDPDFFFREVNERSWIIVWMVITRMIMTQQDSSLHNV